MPHVTVLIVAALAIFAGATVQGTVGLGVSLVGAPIIALADPALVPGAVLIVAAAMTLLSLAREWRHVQLRGAGWVVAGRVMGTFGGLWVVATLPERGLGLAVGVMVLVAVAVTARTGGIPRRRATMLAAGTVSGVTGTATSIGGPPIALLYQDAGGPRIRATLAALFCVGAVFSLVTLAVTGQLHAGQVATGVLMLPPLFGGFLASGPLRRHVDAGRARAALLITVSVSATVLIVHSAV